MRGLQIADDKNDVLSSIDFGDTAFSEIATAVGKREEVKEGEEVIQEGETDEAAVARSVADFLAGRVYRHRRDEQRKEITRPTFTLK